MSEQLRVSGKKFKLPSVGAAPKLSFRPGGWVVVETAQGVRQRIMMLEQKGVLSASLGGVLYSGQVSSERHGAGGASGGDSDLIAQFPGKVRKVLAKAGARVKEGEPLILVEAMKMEFTVKAPFDGEVIRFLVDEGRQISPGDRFLEMKEDVKENE